MGGSADSIDSKLTYDDYVDLPDDGLRYEILDGDLAVTASPTTRHQGVVGNLYALMREHVGANALGRVLFAPVDVILDRSTVAVPDLVFVSNERAAYVTRRAIEGPPDLVVEILSPSTGGRDRGVKMKLYARFGVERYWLIEPDARTIEIFRREDASFVAAERHEGPGRLACDVPAGLVIDPDRVWED